MNSYHNLAPYYHALFPVSPPLKERLAPLIETARARRLPWLDVGCGTGALVEWLLKQGVKAVGIDPDEGFVREANRRIGASNSVVNPGSLSDLQRFAARGAFGIVTCLGNVLAHAANWSAVIQFFQDVDAALAPGGALIVQTVNFDRILEDPSWEFPVIARTTTDGTPLRFERRYRLDDPDDREHIVFATLLRAGGRSYRNTASLLPVMHDEAMHAARMVFGHVRMSGDFKGAVWTRKSPATILEACKSNASGAFDPSDKSG